MTTATGATRAALVLAIMLLAALVGLPGLWWGLPREAHDLYFTTGESERAAVEAIRRHRDQTEAAAREGRAAPEPLPRSAYNAIRSYHPDEYYNFKMLSGIRPGEFRFDPQWYVIGGAYLYPLGAWLKGVETAGLVRLDPRPEYYIEHPDEMSDLYVAGRLLTVLTGAAAVGLIVLIATRLCGRGPGIFAGLLVTLSPLFAMHASFMYNDIPGMLWVSLCVLFTISLFENGRARDYVLCGLFAGLAAGTKLFDGFVLLLPVAAHWMRPRGNRRGVLVPAILAAAVVTFLATNPYYLVKLPEVAGNFRSHLRTGTSFAFYVKSLAYGFGVLPMLLALAGWVKSAARRDRMILLIGCWTAAYFVVMSLFGKQFARYLLPIFPSLALMAAYFCARASRTCTFADTTRRNRTPLRSILTVGACGLILLLNLLTAGPMLLVKGRKDSRTVAGEWILGNLDAGDRIAVTEEPWQFEMPPMDARRFRIVVCGYDAAALLREAPNALVYSDLQSDPEVNPHPEIPEEGVFWEEVRRGAAGSAFRIALAAPDESDKPNYLCALGLWREPPEDMRYVSPQVYVLRRTGGG
jgi:hypothetical protein